MARTVLSHDFQFVQERPYGPVHGQFQLYLGHVDLGRQMVLHFCSPQDRYRNGLVDFHVHVGKVTLGVTAFQAQTGQTVSFGKLQDDDFLL